MDSATAGRVDHAPTAQSPLFRELVARRRRLVRAGLGVSIVWFGGFLLLTSYAHDFMRLVITPGLTVAYVLGLSQFVLVWVLTAAYLRVSRTQLDPLRDRVRSSATGVEGTHKSQAAQA